MLPTDREALAYDIRRDAEYTRRRIADHDHDPDSPTLPAALDAADRFAAWCDTASDELLKTPEARVEEVRETWRREAVASDVRFIPHGELAVLACLGFGTMGAMLAVAGFVSGSVTLWINAAVLAATAGLAFGYTRWTPSRPAVGPDAQHSTLAAASAREILNFETKPQKRRYQPKTVRKRVQ